MRTRKELLAKRRELKKELKVLTTKKKKSTNHQLLQIAENFVKVTRFVSVGAEIRLLNWILDKPTKRQLKHEALMKQQKNGKGR